MKTTLKNGFYLVTFSLLASLVTSCLGDNKPEDVYPLTDAELISFNLSSDSVPNLKNVVFSIDQRAGRIYNYDSMAYLTTIKDKVIINYTSGAGANNVLNLTNGDSIWVSSGDSIDISQPLSLKVFALDGKTEKYYTAQLHIHQVDPDSVQYIRIASDLPFLQTEETKTIFFNNRFFTYSKIENEIQLHSSSDAVNWARETLSGLPLNTVVKAIQNSQNQIFAYTEAGLLYTCYDNYANNWALVNTEYPVKSILGYLNASANQTGGLSLVVEKDGQLVFAFTENATDWIYGAAVPGNFPLHDFSSRSYQLMHVERISIFGGISSDGEVQNAVWSTQNGYYWAKLTANTSVFPPLRGANVFYYNQEFWLLNGKSDDGNFNKEVYYSVDGGITWKSKPEKCQMPADFPNRSGASLVVDSANKYFYLIGGKQDAALLDIWKGFLNNKDFEH